MSAGEARSYLEDLPEGWTLVDEVTAIEKRFDFGSYRAVIDFVNEVAEIAEEEGHHPDMGVHYDHATVRITTHAIGGLSENDFILAAKIEARKEA